MLQHGGLVAFPTDTVYGLAALPFKSEFVEGLFSAKGRNNTRAIAILIGDYADLDRVVEKFDDKSSRLAHRFWPGPLTLVVPKHRVLPGASRPMRRSVCACLTIRSLWLCCADWPSGSHSANISGEQNANTAEEVTAS